MNLDLPPDDPDLDNPYAPPRSTFVPDAAPPPISGGIPFTVGDVFAWSWALFRQRMWPCIYLFWGVFGVNWAIGFAMQMVIDGLTAVVRERALLLLLNGIINLTAGVVQLWLGIGVSLGLLKIARHEPVSFDVVFTGGRFLVTVILGAIIVGVIVLAPVFILGVGLLALFVMMQRMGSVVVLLFFVFGCGMGAVWLLYMSARLMLYYYFAIDRSLGVFDSIQRCWQTTRDRAATIILVYLLQPCILLGGLLAFCVGLIWAVPLSTLLNVVTYLALTGPARAADKAPPTTRDDDIFYPAGI